MESGESITLNNNWYYYFPSYNNGAPSEQAYTFMSRDGNGNYDYYWLVSTYVSTREGYAIYGIRKMDGGVVYGTDVLYSYGSTRGNKYGIRPVIVLNPSVTVTPEGDLSI